MPTAKIIGHDIDRPMLKLETPSHGKSEWEGRGLLQNHPQYTTHLDMRSERKAFTVTVQANDPFPDGPSEIALADTILRCKSEEQHHLLEELFEQRPMWTRPAILAM